MTINRRELLTYGASALGVAAVGLPHFASAEGNELTIAYNVNLPSWDPTTGPSAVNPTIQGLYQSVFDQFIPQKPDLSARTMTRKVTHYGDLPLGRRSRLAYLDPANRRACPADPASVGDGQTGQLRRRQSGQLFHLRGPERSLPQQPRDDSPSRRSRPPTPQRARASRRSSEPSARRLTSSRPIPAPTASTFSTATTSRSPSTRTPRARLP